MIKKSTISAAILMALLANQAIAQDSNIEQQSKQSDKFDVFYEDSERGWFWYEENGVMVKKPIEEKKTEQPTVIPPAPTTKEEAKKTKEKPLSTAWFRENFPKYRDAAIDHPNDPEAMRTYLYLAKYMREKAIAFTYARQAAIYAEPFLDETANRSTASYGMNSMNVDAQNRMENTLKTLGKTTGIFFFYRSDCPYCAKQAPIVKILENKYGFAIKPVAIDGKEMPEPLWDNYLTNVDQAQNLGVKKVPALYLFEAATGKIELISQGLQSGTQLEKRILYSANRAGLISNDKLKLTRPTGLYPDLDGVVGVKLSAPDDAPQEFKELLDASVEQPQAE